MFSNMYLNWMSCFVSGYFTLYASCFRVISTAGTEWLKVSNPCSPSSYSDPYLTDNAVTFTGQKTNVGNSELWKQSKINEIQGIS